MTKLRGKPSQQQVERPKLTLTDEEFKTRFTDGKDFKRRVEVVTPYELSASQIDTVLALLGDHTTEKTDVLWSFVVACQKLSPEQADSLLTRESALRTSKIGPDDHYINMSLILAFQQPSATVEAKVTSANYDLTITSGLAKEVLSAIYVGAQINEGVSELLTTFSRQGASTNQLTKTVANILGVVQSAAILQDTYREKIDAKVQVLSLARIRTFTIFISALRTTH